MKPITLLLIPVILFVSFLPKQDGVNITFQNDTNETFKMLKVDIFGTEFLFKDLKKGEQTDPIHVPRTYRFCYARAITEKDTLLCLPCRNGEKIYNEGNFLMKLFRLRDEKYMGITCDDLDRIVSGTSN